MRKEVGQAVGVAIPTGCVPRIIRKCWSFAAFCQLNSEEEKIQSSLEQKDSVKCASWDEGAGAWLNVKRKRGRNAPFRDGEVIRKVPVLSNAKNCYLSQLMVITVTNI